MDDETYLNMIYTFESLLCFWAWLKKDKYWKIDADKEALQTAEHAICILMGKIKSLWPRNQGCEWKKPKFHETYRNAFNIHLFGKPANWHSGPAEHNHICHVKNVAKKTQKRRLVFDLQLGNRLVDKFIIDKAYAQIQHTRHRLGLQTMEPIITMENASLETTTNMGGKYIVFIKQLPNGKIDLSYKWLSNQPQYYQLPEPLLQAIVHQRFMLLSRAERLIGKYINGFTKYHRNNTIFRAHPNYCNEKRWYDYVMLAWEDDSSTQTLDDSSMQDNDSSLASASVLQNSVQLEKLNVTKKVNLVLAQTMGFVENDEGSIDAIVHSCHEGSRKLSVLTNRW
jgi:hypothetical protein